MSNRELDSINRELFKLKKENDMLSRTQNQAVKTNYKLLREKKNLNILIGNFQRASQSFFNEIEALEKRDKNNLAGANARKNNNEILKLKSRIEIILQIKNIAYQKIRI